MSGSNIKPLATQHLAVTNTAAVNREHELRRKQRHLKEINNKKHEAEQLEAEDLDLELSSIDNTSFSDNNAWDTVMAKVQAGKTTLNSPQNLSASSIAAKFNSRLLNEEEVHLLISYYEDSDINNESESLLDNLESCPEGQELSLLNDFFGGRELSTSQKYMLLLTLHSQLLKRNKKEHFTKQLKAFIYQFEQQNSGFLFEFFALIGNKQVTAKFSPDAVDALATINSAEININDLRTTIGVIEQISGEDFSNIVPLYMQSRIHQLKALQEYKGSFDDKSKLYELMAFERNLLQIHALYVAQTAFVKKRFDQGK